MENALAGLAMSILAERGCWTGTKTITDVCVQPDNELKRNAAKALAKFRESA